MESYTFDFGHDPDANALYRFTLGGIRVLHIGDIGNPVFPAHLEALRGNVDPLFALAGARATIALVHREDVNHAARDVTRRRWPDSCGSPEVRRVAERPTKLEASGCSRSFNY